MPSREEMRHTTHAGCGAAHFIFMSQSRYSVQMNDKGDTDMAMETLPSGSILHGRYRIERVLGSGGFGHVYLAVHLQTHVQYALKEYLVTGASGKVQLEHEARVLSQHTHKSLPRFQADFDERRR